jgi:hypothetical protein
MDLKFSKIQQHDSLKDGCRNIFSSNKKFKILIFDILLSMDNFIKK